MTILLVIAAGFVFIILWAFFVEPNWYRFKRIKVHIPKKIHKPFSILHLSDIHFCKNGGAKKRFFQRLSMLNPDLIFVTGDTIDNDEGIETATRTLSGLRARYGTFLILGNHDYFDYHWKDVFLYNFGVTRLASHRNNIEHLITEMKRIGINVLVNQAAKVEVHGNPVLIGGTNDPMTQRIDFEKTLHGLGPNTLNILLTHHLDSVLKLSHRGVDMVFAGHTHGGQIRIPLLGSIVCEIKLPRRYIGGLHRFKDMITFVSRGLGASRLTFPRFACRPEAVWFDMLP
jgi:hypothetical protein